MGKPADQLEGLDPFGIFDIEAERLARFFASLEGGAWDRPSRCAGWSVKDVLGHLAGEELYNHACLQNDLAGLLAKVSDAGITGPGDYNAFNEWCVRERRDVPAAQVLDEWLAANGETRRRMRELGRDGMLDTSVGKYPAWLQTFHFCSEFATHADDVGAPIAAHEEPGRTRWRAQVGLFALHERESPLLVEPAGGGFVVTLEDTSARLSAGDFVAATVDRLEPDDPLAPEVRAALVCLA
ncbi:MAG: maleylpyruvate isomerase family mycothiol-dependent enzyme [Micromonosporaceae bacterium]